MSFENDDKELMEMMKGLRGKKPPRQVLQNFENNVMKKIHQSAPFLGIGWVPVVCVSAALAAGLVFFLLHKQQPVPETQPVLVAEKALDSFEEVTQTEKISEVSTPFLPQVTTQLPPKSQTGVTALPVSELQTEEAAEQVFNRFSENLLLLQMLGEDQGLVDNARLMESDVEILSQLGSPSVPA